MGGGRPSEATLVREFLSELAEQDFEEETIEAFRDAARAMLAHDVPDVADLLASIKSAMRNEYGD
jgi:hypothetical protein